MVVRVALVSSFIFSLVMNFSKELVGHLKKLGFSEPVKFGVLTYCNKGGIHFSAYYDCTPSEAHQTCCTIQLWEQFYCSITFQAPICTLKDFQNCLHRLESKVRILEAEVKMATERTKLLR